MILYKFMNRNMNICNNCGKQGHVLYNCKLPIISFGIVAFRYELDETQFLMIRRKDSFGYIDFIRGKYSPYNLTQLLNTVDEMSLEEKSRILSLPFEKLWKDMWGETSISNNQFKNEEVSSKKKFDMLNEGLMTDEGFYTLKDIVNMSKTKWSETEWEFPKGRRNQKEKDLDCALREFEEETGISKNNLSVVENILPFEEIFIGSDHKSYKHKYLLAFVENDIMNTKDLLNNYQVTEVSKIEWKSLDNCLESIRPYHLEKKNLIINISKVLKEYRLYS
jgi:8-oxo-dGTP pyrophosphatase MutT (NUDIX family)